MFQPADRSCRGRRCPACSALCNTDFLTYVISASPCCSIIFNQSLLPVRLVRSERWEKIHWHACIRRTPESGSPPSQQGRACSLWQER
ncbi:hypothetical protein Hsero_2385 [Herbaspirillum seropedicae SmR1]|uniref:Uncharacterized protein n=1 Tax=Herbaspirillum seropedicae (strain SmR1) TaxID=757424 RepID=D8IVE5_HERSS|nr:hypothetical protein Hsero_2385 [Herbaspirillum seropedicae SmR1]